ncbi:SWI/SNF chromatin-remodeling complex subunit SNF5 isoform X2 [Nilaparvata lugens]|uniref:SWI/SNF chromatin-remodeling complex subunit SNF5 isoform X2 n=1 Tax=Nilaparvata lugens TaxID=108931 RepID=UPI00193EA54D|nr:SWI/SNF chromatin-remodeling complex subunit SNF5 isoform X2 [Nilaparvata lugens]
MEKQQEAAQDSISSIGKPEYPPSEVYVPEAPPAYRRERGTAVQVARIAGLTVIAVSVIISFSMLASAYITATMSCTPGQQTIISQEHLPLAQAQRQTQEQQKQSEDDEQSSYQNLVDPLQSDESSDNKHETLLPPPPPAPNAAGNGDSSGFQFKMPLQLDFDEIAGSLMEKNQRSRMNCVVEKRRAEEVMDHQPKTVRLPFGVNVTTDPRYEHITGERMAIFCESGHDQRHVPMESMGTPVVVPVPMQMHQGGPVPMGMPMPMGGQHHGPMHQHMMSPQQQQQQQMPPHAQHMPMHQGPHPQMHMMPSHLHQQPHMMAPPQQQQQQSAPQPISLNQIPLNILTRIAQESMSESGNEPIHIIARTEEHVIPIEGRAMHMRGEHPVASEMHLRGDHPVPSDMVRPPPPPFQRLPVHVMQQQGQGPIALAAAANEVEQPRPHFVQPRSIRSVDSVFHKREKRVRRCACDCSC